MYKFPIGCMYALCITLCVTAGGNAFPQPGWLCCGPPDPNIINCVNVADCWQDVVLCYFT